LRWLGTFSDTQEPPEQGCPFRPRTTVGKWHFPSPGGLQSCSQSRSMHDRLPLAPVTLAESGCPKMGWPRRRPDRDQPGERECGSTVAYPHVPQIRCCPLPAEMAGVGGVFGAWAPFVPQRERGQSREDRRKKSQYRASCACHSLIECTLISHGACSRTQSQHGGRIVTS